MMPVNRSRSCHRTLACSDRRRPVWMARTTRRGARPRGRPTARLPRPGSGPPGLRGVCDRMCQSSCHVFHWSHDRIPHDRERKRAASRPPRTYPLTAQGQGRFAATRGDSLSRRRHHVGGPTGPTRRSRRDSSEP